MQKPSLILITGGSGMIGSSLVGLLRAQGYTNLLAPTHAELNLCDAQAVDRYFLHHRPEYVFHLAARVGGIHANNHYPGQFIYDNTIMQLNVFEASRKNSVKKLLFPGSACTYPLSGEAIKESAFLTGNIEPTNLAYAAAKINGIVMAQSYVKQYGMHIIIPMPTNAYGIGDNFSPEASHVIPALMQRFHDAKQNNVSEVVIWGDGSPLREFIYADDVADAFLLLMRQYDSSELMNVGSGEETSIHDLANIIAKTVGYAGNIRFDTSKPNGAARKLLDSSRLFALGWKPRTTLEQGIKQMYEHHFLATARKAL